MKIYQANDIHIEDADPQTHAGANAYATAFVSALSGISDADAVVINGDVSELTSEQSHAAGYFSGVTQTMYVTAGNHDVNTTAQKSTFATLWGMPTGLEGELVTYHYSVDIQGVRLIFLDTNWTSGDIDGGSLDGRLPSFAQTWLSSQLNNTMPAIIFMHHYPQYQVFGGSDWFDTTDEGQIETIVNGRPKSSCLVNGIYYSQAPTYIFGGHIHNTDINDSRLVERLGLVRRYAPAPLFSGKYYSIEINSGSKQSGLSSYSFSFTEYSL